MSQDSSYPLYLKLFQQSVEQNPSFIAVEVKSSRLTYKELDEKSDQLAFEILHLTTLYDKRVGVCLERSIESIVSLLAVLKAGKTYVPILSNTPEERQRHILRTSGINLVLCDKEHSDALIREGWNTLVLEEIKYSKNIKAKKVVNNVSDFDEPYILFTSGTTGKPKGVIQTRKSLENLILWQSQYPFLSQNTVTLQFASHGFDVSIQEIFVALLSGSTLVLATEEERTDFHLLANLCASKYVKRVFMPFSVLDAFLQVLNNNQSRVNLDVIVSAGEALQVTQNLYRYCNSHTQTTLINQYGPTESHVVTQKIVDLAALEVGDYPSLGFPVGDTQLYVLNHDKQPIKSGEQGELYISGGCLSSGYVNDEKTTLEKYKTLGVAGADVRVYATGDRVVQNSLGEYIYQGRLDDQIKIDGIRIEIGEIEHQLVSYPKIERVCVSLDNGRLTCFYLESSAKENLNIEELKKWLRRYLPNNMIPSKFIRLEEFPLTENGKLDKKKLLRGKEGHLENGLVKTKDKEEYLCSEVATKAMEISRRYLGAEFSFTDNFFEMGGTSLIAMKILADLRSELSVVIKLADVFRTPIFGDLFKNIDLSVNEQDLNKNETRFESLETSYAQLQMWIENERFGRSYTYNTPLIIKPQSRLDLERLVSAFSQIVLSHAVLRSTFTFSKLGLVQRLVAEPENLIKRYDINTEDELECYLEKESKYCFDLEKECPVRLSIFQKDDKQLLLLNFHHIVVDEWSQTLFLKFWSLAYLDSEKEYDQNEVDFRYADFAKWQKSNFSNDHPGIQYWKENLAGCDSGLGTLVNRREQKLTELSGAEYHRSFSKELSAQLVALASQYGVSLYTLLLAIYVYAVCRLGDRNELCVGLPVSLRDSFGAENLIGCLLNTLVIRADISHCQLFSQLVDLTNKHFLNALQHKDVPYERVVEEVLPNRTALGESIFSTMFVLRDSFESKSAIFGVDCDIEDVYLDQAKFDITIFVRNEKDAIHLSVEYNQNVIDESMVISLVDAFENISQQVPVKPSVLLSDLNLGGGHLSILKGVESDLWRGMSVAEVFRESANEFKRNVSIVSEGKEITYQELESMSNCVAQYLWDQGLRKGDVVAFYQSHHSDDYIMAFLGILKIGAVCLPLDNKSPQDRLAYILKDAQCRWILANHKDCISRLPEGEVSVSLLKNCVGKPLEIELPALSEHDVASIMYTSGSTGNPKGVLVPHRAINRLAKNREKFCLPDEIRALHMAPIAFDASTFEIWLPLLNGGVSIQYPYSDFSLGDFKKLLSRERVNVLWLTSSLFNLIVDSDLSCLSGIKSLIIGGEALSVKHVDRANKALEGTQIINGYGPTENTTFTTCFPIPKESVSDWAAIPIGYPIDETSLVVMNQQNQILPVGVPGELYAGGLGVAKGYLNLRELNSQRFIEDKWTGGELLYATGDICRITPGGVVEYLGRKDNQFKIRGMRIEIQEIENTLERYPKIKNAHVSVLGDDSHARQIVAFVVNDDSKIEDGDLKNYLKQCLPSYMVPNQIFFVKHILLTSNGKVDSASLISMVDIENMSAAGGGHENRNIDYSDDELVVLSSISSLLNCDLPNLRDNFFEIGGNSLLAIQLIDTLYLRLGVRYSLVDFFACENIGALIERKSLYSDKPAPVIFERHSGVVERTIVVFHNIGFANNIASCVGDNDSVLGLVCRKHQELAQSIEKGHVPNVSIDEFVSEYYKLIKSQQPEGPYVFVGHSYGGLIAFALASFMQSQSEEVEQVVLFDSILPSALRQQSVLGRVGERILAFASKLRRRRETEDTRLLNIYSDLMLDYQGPGEPYRGKVSLIRSRDTKARLSVLDDYGWQAWVDEPLVTVDVDGDHFSIIKREEVNNSSETYRKILRQHRD